MDQENVDAIDSEPLQAVLERSHHAVVAVVEHGLKLETAEPLILDRVGSERPAQHPADLGRYDEVGARPAVERTPERVFGEPAPVPGGGVEVADAAVPGGFDQPRGFIVAHSLEKLAERRRAEAELGHHHVRPAKLTRFQGREIRAAHLRAFRQSADRERLIPRARFRSAADSPSPRPPRCREQPWSRRRPARTPRPRRRPCDGR